MQRPLNDKVTVAGQIGPDDFPAIGAQGFKSVVCGRPDAEVPPDLVSDVLAKRAQSAGLSFHYIPVVPGTAPSAEDARRFLDAQAEGPVFAYCGGGPRVIMLASFAAAADGAPVDAILAEAAAAGIDLSPARSMLLQTGAAES